MYASRRTGPVNTSVRIHPIRLLILGMTMLGLGVAIAVGNPPLGIPLGALLALCGGRLTHIAGRQILRGVRTFLS